MKKVTNLLIMGVLLFSLFSQNVCAEEKVGNEYYSEVIATQDLQAIFTEMNEMQPGEVTRVGDWKVVCRENMVCSPQSVYSNTKTTSRTFTVSRWGKETNAFSITQTVSYIINDAAGTVSISSYSSGTKIYLADYSVTKKKEITNNVIFNNTVSAYSLYDVYSAKDGTLQINCSATVAITGEVKFRFDFI